MVRIIIEEDHLHRRGQPSTSTLYTGDVEAVGCPTFLSARKLDVSGTSPKLNGRAESIHQEVPVSGEEIVEPSRLGGTARKRAAKATAISALSVSAHRDMQDSATMNAKSMNDSKMPHSSKNPARKVLSLANPLDFSNIRTGAPAQLPPRNIARLFNLEHCPIFYPTIDEFAQPMDYIERVSKESKDNNFGMCKIVPPEGWRPPFVLNTEVKCQGLPLQSCAYPI